MRRRAFGNLHQLQQTLLLAALAALLWSQGTASAVTVTLTTSNTGGGSVTLPGEGVFPYAPGTLVDIIATPAAHFHFTHWTGTAVDAAKVLDPNAAETKVTVDADYTLIANFAIDQFTLTVSCSAGGVVTNPGVGTFTCAYGSLVWLMAQAQPGFVFAGWTGSVFDTQNPTVLTVDCSHDVRATFVSLSDTLYVDSRAVGAADGTVEHPLRSIQEAIEVARTGTKILVQGGVYHERLNFMGKNVRVQGLWLTDPKVTDVPVVDGDGVGPVVTFRGIESADCFVAGLQIQAAYAQDTAAAFLCRGSPIIANCIIAGNTVTGTRGSLIRCQDGNPLFANCTITDNTVEGSAVLIDCENSGAMLSDSIIWGNTWALVRVGSGHAPMIDYCDFQGGWFGGIGNFDADPLFNYLGRWTHHNRRWLSGDYHLQSQAGRFDPINLIWAIDAASSPCIDAGAPTLPVGLEPAPNGGFLNLGAYGGTPQASMSVPSSKE